MEKTTSARLELVTKTTAEWAAVTDVISKGVPCVEITDDGKTLMKVGDGAKTFAELPYVSAAGGSITVDSELSSASDNPVQNKAINAEFEKCVRDGDSLTLKCVL